MKYIVLRRTLGKGKDPMLQDIPIIFPEQLIHADVAAALTAPDGPLEGATAVSAGDLPSFSFSTKPFCGGKSTTLNLESRGESDDALIRQMDYFHGIVNDEG